jgi:hypothetical protein
MKKLLLIAGVVGLSLSTVSAQDAAKPGAGKGVGAHPLMAALDANKNGTLEASEIADASNALKKLDKNSDGQITKEEIRSPKANGGKGQGKSKDQ